MIRRLAIGIFALLASLVSQNAYAAAGITPSGGGKFVTGQTFTITVKASGATFDSLQGTISVSGVAKVVSFSAGSATWLPNKSPSSGGQFVGIVSPTSSLTVATIKLQASKEGTGAVTVSGVRLARSGSEVGTGGGSTSYTIGRAPTPPGQVSVSSSTHPDQAAAYEATTVQLAWEPPANGASGYSVAFDQSEVTVPEQKITTTDKTASYNNMTVGTHYFHIRAQNGDGWSPTTNFKITVKASVNGGLATPAISEVTLAADHQNSIKDGTVTGLSIRGSGPAGYVMKLVFQPTLEFDKVKYPNPTVNDQGQWELLVNDPVRAGFYTLTAQGEKSDVLTPLSTPVSFELAVSDGGSLKIITADDETSAYQKAQEAVKVAAANTRKKQLFGGGALGVLLIGLAAFVWLRRRK